MPNERTAYMMVGAYATQKVAQSDLAQESGQKVMKIIQQKLDSYIDEGVEKTKNATK